MLDAWRSARGTTVLSDTADRVAPWSPLYWKTLPVGHACDVLTPVPPSVPGRDRDLARVLLGWRPWDPFRNRP